MTVFYDHERFSKEVFFDELEEGQSYPPFSYRLTKDHIELYLRSVEEGTSPDRDDFAKLATSLAAVNYGFFYSAISRRPPTGYINAAVEFEFLKSVPLDRDLTMLVRVEQKFIKRERKYIIYGLYVSDGAGQSLVRAKVDCIFPK